MSDSEAKGQRTTAAEVSRNFGRWQDRALQGAVHVSHHGRPRVVIVSAEDYGALTQDAGAGPPAQSPPAVGAVSINNLLQNLSEGFVSFDADLRVTAANPPALTAFGPFADGIVGRRVDEPQFGEAGRLLAERLRQVLRVGEAIQFEARGFAHPHRYSLNRVFPHGGGVAVVFSNQTELHDLRLEREAWSAQRAAIEALGNVAECELSSLGFFEAANPAFCVFIGFPEPRLKDVRLVDLVVAADRHDLLESLNAVMQSPNSRAVVEVGFMTRDDGVKRLTMGVGRRSHNGICTGVCLAALTP